MTDLGTEVVQQSFHRERLDGAHRTLALGQRSPESVGGITQRSDQAQTGYDHAALGTKHE